MQGNAQAICHNLQEFTGSGRALIIHLEVLHHTAGHQDDLGILSADIDNCTFITGHLTAASCVAGNLCDNMISKIYGNTAISGCDHF